MNNSSPQERHAVSSGSKQAAVSAYHTPFALNVAASWAWRLIVVAVAAMGIYTALSKVSLVVISVAIAALLAGLLLSLIHI